MPSCSDNFNCTPDIDHNMASPEALNKKKIVVVGLGMVGVSFVEKLISKDKKQKEYRIIVFGEEKYVAYNRVGLTSFFCNTLEISTP
jgi:NAD(P)H-nitrite reductase large subunit